MVWVVSFGLCQADTPSWVASDVLSLPSGYFCAARVFSCAKELLALELQVELSHGSSGAVHQQGFAS